MALSNAERQRRYIARLKAAAGRSSGSKPDAQIAAFKAQLKKLPKIDRYKAEAEAEWKSIGQAVLAAQQGRVHAEMHRQGLGYVLIKLRREVRRAVERRNPKTCIYRRSPTRHIWWQWFEEWQPPGARGSITRGGKARPAAHWRQGGSLMLFKWLLIALMVVVASPPALAKNFRWTCVYPSGVSPKGAIKDELKLELMFDDVSSTAVVSGNAGMSPIEVHLGYMGATFMEKLASGAVQITTIAQGGASVHSRHAMIGSSLTPSQYYGTCQVQ